MAGSFVRKTAVSARDIKAINAEIADILDRKAENVLDNDGLRYEINEHYIQVVTPYVPYKPKYEGGHLNVAYQTNDGRIIWSSIKKGYNYADIQYQPEAHGVVYSNYTTPGTGSHWTDKVQPGTYDWQYKFIPRVTWLIHEAYKNG